MNVAFQSPPCKVASDNRARLKLMGSVQMRVRERSSLSLRLIDDSHTYLRMPGICACWWGKGMG